MKKTISPVPVLLVILGTFGFLQNRFLSLSHSHRVEFQNRKDSIGEIGSDKGIPKITQDLEYKLNSINAKTHVSLKVRTLLNNEAPALDSLDENPDATEDRLREIASNLTTDEINELSTLVVNGDHAANEKVLATYLLTLVGPRAQNGLTRIFVSNSENLNKQFPPHSVEESIQQGELSMRLMALQAIETNLHSSRLHFPKEVRSANTYLNNMAKLVRLGEATQRPLLRETLASNIKPSGDL
jgi:hypothetical protein